MSYAGNPYSALGSPLVATPPLQIAGALPPPDPALATNSGGSKAAIPGQMRQPQAPEAPAASSSSQQPLITPDQAKQLANLINPQIPDSVAVTPEVTDTGGAFGGVGNSGALGMSGSGGILQLLGSLFGGGGG